MAKNYDLSVRLRTAVEGLNEVSRLIAEIDELGGVTEESASRSQSLSDEIRKLQKAEDLVGSFRKLKLEVEDTGEELGKAQQETQRLGRELANSSQPTKKLEKDFEKARKTVQRLKETQQDQVRALQNNRQELSKAGIDSRNLSKAQVEIRQSMARTNSEIDELTQSLKAARDQSAKEFKDPTDRLERGARSAGDQVETLGSKIRNVAGIAIGSVAAFFGIREAVEGIAGIARVGGEFEILQKRLEALTGSAEAGEEAFAWIQDFTKNTPFQLDQVTDAFVRAKAFGLDPMDGTLQAIADQASKTGGGMESLNGIVTALGQAYSKGKIQAEEMLQLIERGVPAWDLLADATGRSVAELQEMTTAGELGRKEIELLIKAIGESSAGAAQSQMQTLQGLVSNLADTWTQFLNEINNAGLLEYLKGQIRDLGRAFQEMRESGELQAWAKRISDAIIGLIEALKTGASTLYEYRDAIAATAKAFVVFKAAQLAVGVTQFARLIRTQAITAMADLGTSTGAATGKVGKLSAGLRAIPGPAKVLALAAAFLGFDKVLVAAGESLGEFLAKNSDAARALEETRKRIEENSRANIERLDEEIGVLEQYRQARRVTAEEAISLSEEERQAAEERLKGQEQLFAKEIIKLLELENLGLNVGKAMAKLRGDLDDTRDALGALANASELSGRAIESGISSAAQELVDRFQEMTRSGKDASEAIEELFDGFDASSVSGVRDLVDAIGEISSQSVAAGSAIQSEIRDRLDDMTGQELRRFSITLAAAFDGGTEAAGRFKALAEEIGDAALQNIGTSLQEIRTGISLMESEALESFQAFRDSGKRSAEEVAGAVEALQGKISSPEAVDQLRTLLSTWEGESKGKIEAVEKALDTLAESVKGTAEQLATELKESIESAGDEEAIAEVSSRIRKLWNEGKIGAEEYTTALGQVRDRQRELSKETEEGGDKAIQKQKELAEQTKKTAESAEEIRNKFRKAWGDAFGQAITTARENVTALSTAARNLFEMKIGGNAFVSEGQTSAEALAKVEQRIDELNSARQRLMSSSFGAWFADTALASAEVERQFYAQAVAMERLQEEVESGAYSMADLDAIAGRAANRFDLLDEQRLQGLQTAIDTAKAKVQQLSDSLADTVSSLRQEIAGLEGDTLEVERLRNQERILELEEQLQRARDLGDQEAIRRAQEALQLQQKAYKIRLDQARQQEEADRERAARDAAEAERRRQQEEIDQREREKADFSREERNADRLSNATSQLPTRRIEIAGPSGATASLSVTDQEEGDLISVLEELGSRSV